MHFKQCCLKYALSITFCGVTDHSHLKNVYMDKSNNLLFPFYSPPPLSIRSIAPPTPKLACFVLYLKIVNTFMKNNFASYSKLSRNSKITSKFMWAKWFLGR